MIEVGKNFKRTVTRENAELYKEFMSVIERSADNKKGYWHFGREDIGNLVTHITDNYDLKRR